MDHRNHQNRGDTGDNTNGRSDESTTNSNDDNEAVVPEAVLKLVLCNPSSSVVATTATGTPTRRPPVSRKRVRPKQPQPQQQQNGEKATATNHDSTEPNNHCIGLSDSTLKRVLATPSQEFAPLSATSAVESATNHNNNTAHQSTNHPHSNAHRHAPPSDDALKQHPFLEASSGRHVGAYARAPGLPSVRLTPPGMHTTTNVEYDDGLSSSQPVPSQSTTTSLVVGAMVDPTEGSPPPPRNNFNYSHNDDNNVLVEATLVESGRDEEQSRDDHDDDTCHNLVVAEKPRLLDFRDWRIWVLLLVVSALIVGLVSGMVVTSKQQPVVPPMTPTAAPTAASRLTPSPTPNAREYQVLHVDALNLRYFISDNCTRCDIHALTHPELVGIMLQTQAFYEHHLVDYFPELRRFVPILQESVVRKDLRQIRLGLEAHIYFPSNDSEANDDNNSTSSNTTSSYSSLPTLYEMDDAMMALNYTVYLHDYVWTALPAEDNLFHAMHHVEFFIEPLTDAAAAPYMEGNGTDMGYYYYDMGGGNWTNDDDALITFYDPLNCTDADDLDCFLDYYQDGGDHYV